MNVKIYAANSDTLCDNSIFTDKLNSISEFRQKKAMCRKQRSDRNMSIAAGLLLNEALKPYGLSEADMYYKVNEYGKPFFANAPNFHFNISHSSGIVICAFSDFEIGCDIEKIRYVDLNIAKRFFSKNEYEYINSCPEPEKYSAFFDIWTAKESLVKAMGKSVSYFSQFDTLKNGNLNSLEFNNKKYYFKKYTVFKTYKITACGTKYNFADSIKIINI